MRDNHNLSIRPRRRKKIFQLDLRKQTEKKDGEELKET